MIDTIAFNYPANEPLIHRKKCHDALKFRRSRWLRRTNIVECSLPKLLFGHNGKLIETQAQLDEALARFSEQVKSGIGRNDILSQELQRLDLVWQFEGLQSSCIIGALSAERFPGVKKFPIHRPEEGLAWTTASSHFTLRLYDKAKKMRVPGDVLRIEVGLMFAGLSRLNGCDWRKFQDLWHCYREIVTCLPTVRKVDDVKGWPEAVGLIIAEADCEKILALMQNKSKRSIRDYRRRLRSAANSPRKTLSFSEHLPKDGPPEPSSVIPRRRALTVDEFKRLHAATATKKEYLLGPMTAYSGQPALGTPAAMMSVTELMNQQTISAPVLV